jgi:hypothetical protein
MATLLVEETVGDEAGCKEESVVEPVDAAKEFGRFCVEYVVFLTTLCDLTGLKASVASMRSKRINTRRTEACISGRFVMAKKF